MNNIVSNTWTRDRLKDVAEINACSLGANTAPDYEFHYLEISNVDYFGVVSEDAIEQLSFEGAPSRARRKVHNDDVLVSSVRPNLQAITHIAQINRDLICSTGFNILTPHQWRIHSRFLYYFILSEGIRQHFEAIAKGVGYPALDDKDFGGTYVSLPPLPEQKRIAAYLESGCAAIDRAVKTKKKQLETLDTLRKSIIQKAVTQGLNPDVEIKDSGVQWLGPVPKHWSVKKLKRVFAKINYGISESTNQEGNYAVLKMGNIVNGEIAFTKIEYVDEVSPNLILETFDLLFNRTNSFDQVAKVGIFRGTKDDDISYASYLVRLRANHNPDPVYLNYLLNPKAFLSLARKMAIPSVQQANLNPSRYCRLEVPVPPLTEQIEIREFLDFKVAEISEIEVTLNSQIDTLNSYRKSLIHECVTGKRRVTDADVVNVEAHV